MKDNEISYNTFFIFWSLLQHNVLQICWNLIYYVFYRFEFPFIEKYKTNFEEPWPWHQEPEKWSGMVWKSIMMCAFNGNITFIAFYYPFTLTPLFHPHEMSVEGLPTAMTLIGTVFFCMICEDTGFYFIHRIMHHPSVYQYVHKMHHEYSTTTSIAAEYSHPLEYAFGVMLPTAIGPAILGH